MSRNTANSIAAAEDAAAMATNTTNTTISAMDSFIPTIPEVSADDIEAKFPHKVLTKIEGQPTYAGFFKLREEVYQNALTSKSPFRGATYGHLGVVMGAQAYTLATGNIWAIPASAGVYPTFPAAANETMKRKLMSTFISTERGIRQWEATSNLLRNQLLQAIDEEYYAELYDPIFRYETVRPNDFLAHILNNYAEIDDEVLEQNKKEFQEPPDLSLPIDVYYRKQERCKQLAADGGVPISEPDLVLQLQIHMGQTGQINSSYTKWKRKSAADRKWTTGKAFFRTAIKEAGVIGKLQGDNDFQANSITKKNKTTDNVRDEMVEQMGEAFDNLAMAATAKNDTIESMVKSISDLTTANKQLTAANQTLTQQLKVALEGNNRGNGGGSGGTSGGGSSTGKKEFPAWSDPNAYCFTCGYKLRTGHDSANCPKAKDNPGHKTEATRANPMGGSLRCAGWGNKPDGKERK